MKILLVAIPLALLFAMVLASDAFGEDSAFLKTVKFIQYLDENTALEEVRNGNLDVYYYRISSDRLESPESREDLQVFDSTGGSYSILVNPADSEKFNPFSEREARFALNYLIDRNLIVNELMGGYGAPMLSYYGPSDPEYLTVIEQLEKFNFRYNPALANEMISDSLEARGAVNTDGRWLVDGKPIEVTIFIRSDDPVRRSIGEILASELQKMGLGVKKEFGDLNKAFVVVYGSDPADLKWNLYTEGWGRSAFVRYDSVGLGQMYAPWFSNMPGFNDLSYWNYKNDQIDALTKRIYTGDFTSSEERESLVQEAVKEGIDESVRVFLASKVDQYVAGKDVRGIVNDLGAGVPSRFTPINARNDKGELDIGVKQIYQGAWNPVMGFGDTYSRHIWGIISDPATFKHPFSGETIPIRADWSVETAGPDRKMDIPDEAKIWDPAGQRWKNVSPDAQSTSKVTFDFKFGNWHNGQMMDMNDILHSLYFAIEWGTQVDEGDKTFDAEFTPRAAQMVQSIVGVNQVDEDTIEVYVDYWHFDKGEIAEWASLWSTVPWEISAAMEHAVIDGKAAFSRSGATSKNVNWISLIIPKDAKMIQEYLEKFRESRYVPESLQESHEDAGYYASRYDASIRWIEDHSHAVISNGPFFLESYSPESRTITVSRFNDDTYPFAAGHWSEFENAKFPKILGVKIPDILSRKSSATADIEASNADSILYFLSNSKGDTISSGSVRANSTVTSVVFPTEVTERMDVGANELKIFAVSDSVLRPDYYATSFLATDNNDDNDNNNDGTLPEASQENIEFDKYGIAQAGWVLVPIAVIIAAVLIARKRVLR